MTIATHSFAGCGKQQCALPHAEIGMAFDVATDVVVVGGGPAGLAAALAVSKAAPKLKVNIHWRERTAVCNSNTRVCMQPY